MQRQKPESIVNGVCRVIRILVPVALSYCEYDVTFCAQNDDSDVLYLKLNRDIQLSFCFCI